VTQNPETGTEEIRGKLGQKSGKGNEDDAQEWSHGRADRGSVAENSSPSCGSTWKGQHACRRGLATNLHELGVPDIVIQAILRHEDVSTTQRSYIKTVPEVVTAAMKRLEAQIACTALVQQVSPRGLVN